MIGNKIDAHKMAVLLRGSLIPLAYVYPPKMRSTRDLLRRRMHFMYKRSELLAHIQSTRGQYNLPDFNRCIARKRNRAGVLDHFEDKSVRKSIELNLSRTPNSDRIWISPVMIISILSYASGTKNLNDAMIWTCPEPETH